jgi:hypothetical protein
MKTLKYRHYLLVLAFKKEFDFEMLLADLRTKDGSVTVITAVENMITGVIGCIIDCHVSSELKVNNEYVSQFNGKIEIKMQNATLFDVIEKMIPLISQGHAEGSATILVRHATKSIINSFRQNELENVMHSDFNIN